MWKALGKAAVLHEATNPTPLVLLTTDVPPPRSTGDGALRALCGPDRAVRAVVVIGDPDAPDSMRVLASGSS
jgi:hypothetical protein